MIAVVGDSLSAAHRIEAESGWVVQLQQRLFQQGYAYDVRNASISGDTTSGGLTRLPRLLETLQPAIVILELGGNDGLRGLSVAAMRSNLASMIRLARDSGATVMLIGMKIPPNYGPRYTTLFHDAFQQLADEWGVALVPFLLAGIAERRELMQSDGIHPTAEAQTLILDNVWPHLVPLLGRE